MAVWNKNDIGFGIMKINGKKKRKIEKGKKYKLPERANYIHVYAGMLSFGYAKNGLSKKVLKTNRGKFFKRPDLVVIVSFPEYEYKNFNFNYGKPYFNFNCCNCGDEIPGEPYIKNSKPYCCICGRRLELGLLGNTAEQNYKGLRING